MAVSRQIRRLLRRYEPAIQKAFLASIEEIVSKVVLSEVVEALERGSIEEAIAAMHVEPAAFDAFREARGAAYVGAGEDTVSAMPRGARGRLLVVRFDTRAPNAETFLITKSSEKVTYISDEQLQVLRSALEAGMARGDNPLTVARDIAGRINPKTGRREGGIVGLTRPQEKAVRAARVELSSKETVREYLRRKMRDRSLDPIIKRALKEDRDLTRPEVKLLVDRYSDRLLDLRARTIARTEAMAALHAGKRQAYQQAIDEGSLKKEEIKRIWDSTGDNKVRDSHKALDGTEVGWDEPYTSPVTQASIMYPGDPDAPAEERINCRCDEKIRIDFLARVKKPRVSAGGDPQLPSPRLSLPGPAEDVTPPIDIEDRVAPRGRRS